MLKRRLQRYDVDLLLDMDNVLYKKGNIIVTEDFLIQHHFIFFTACFREEVDHAHYANSNHLVIVKEDGSSINFSVHDEDTKKEIEYFLGAILHGVKNDCDSLWNEIPEIYRKQTTTSKINQNIAYDSVNKTTRKFNYKANINSKINLNRNPKLLIVGAFVALYLVLFVVGIASVFNDVSVATPEPQHRFDSLDMLYDEYINEYPYYDISNSCDIIIAEGKYLGEYIVTNPCDAVSDVDIDFYDADNNLVESIYVPSLLPYNSVLIMVSEYDIVEDYSYYSYIAGFDGAPILSSNRLNTTFGVTASDKLMYIAVEDLDDDKAIALADYYSTYAILAYKDYQGIYLYEKSNIDDNFIMDYDLNRSNPDYVIAIDNAKGEYTVEDVDGRSYLFYSY